MEKPTLARKATPQNTSDIQVESAIKRSVKSVSKQAIKRKEYDEETLPVTFHAPKGGVQMIILSKDVAVYDPAPLPKQCSTPGDEFTRRYLNSFRGEPAISRFDWPFTPSHKSSANFSTLVGSVLQLVLPNLQPAHG